MSDNRKEAEEKMAKAIFISADCWLCVYDLLPPSQLGLGIALISHRFDFYVDEHFKTRKWALKSMQIWRTIGENGTKEMQIVNLDEIPLPIPQIQVPRKVIGFSSISISFIDQNAIAFLRRFRQLFDVCPINLVINTNKDRIMELILRNIWPMLATNICAMQLSDENFRRLRQFVPSILDECPSLRIFSFHCDGLFVEFPCDDNAMASDGQALAKWLFTARPDDVPKVFNCPLHNSRNWASKMEALKAAFASASSPANFIVSLLFCDVSPYGDDAVVPFDQTNELTREQLTLKKTDKFNRFLLIRCPIARDESKWTKWEEEAIGWRTYDQRNRINIRIDNEVTSGTGFSTQLPTQVISSRSERLNC